MKKATRLLSFVLVLVLCLSVLPVGAAAATSNGWVKDTYTYDGNTYTDWYYYQNGSPATGWKKISGSWYYFVPKYGGLMWTGWLNDDPTWFDENGSANGDWYYFYDSGKMAASEWVKNTSTGDDGTTYTFWYYQLSNGKGAMGWLKVGGVWYYFDPYDDGAMVYGGLKEIGGAYYYFKDSGALFTGWKKLPFSDEDGNEWESWVYFTSNGAVESGWKKISGKWYYFIDYEMMADYWVDEDDGDSYRLGSDGAMVTSRWVSDSYTDADGIYVTAWYYQLSNGKSAKGWLKVGGVWYYFDPNYYGEMLVGGPYNINGSYYFFKDSGAMKTGWQKIDGAWWYFTSSGVAKRDGWLQISGKWYQFSDYVCLNP